MTNVLLNIVYARKLYLITSTNLCPETIIEAKTTLRAYSHLKGVSLLIFINVETTMSKYFTKQYIILYLCTYQNHYTCSESGNKITLLKKVGRGFSGKGVG